MCNKKTKKNIYAFYLLMIQVICKRITFIYFKNKNKSLMTTINYNPLPKLFNSID